MAHLQEVARRLQDHQTLGNCLNACVQTFWLTDPESCLQVAGTSGKVRLDDNEEEGLSTEAQGAAIIEALGLAQRNQASNLAFPSHCSYCPHARMCVQNSLSQGRLW